MSLHDEFADPNTPRKVHEWTREAIDAAQCGLCNLADVQVTCAAGASKHDIANLRFRLHVKWGTTEVPLKTPLLPLNITAQDIADSFGCSPPDATPQRKSYRLWLVAVNPRTGGFEEVITRNGAAVVVSADDAPVRPWDCDPQHTAQVNNEFASYMTWRAKNTGRHHNTGQPWVAPEGDDEVFRGDDGDDGDGDDAAFAPPRPPQRFPPQAFPQPFQAPQAFPQAPGFAQPFQAPQAFPQLPAGFAPQALPRPQSAAEAELAEMRAVLAELKADRERQAKIAEEKERTDQRAEVERLRRELEDARRAPQKSVGTTEIVSAFGGVVTALAPLLQHFSEGQKAAAAREEARRNEEERRREDARKEEERRREDARKEEERRREELRREEREREAREEARREEARKEEAQREERRREDARRDEDKREERRREERAEAHKERMATLKAGGGPEAAMAEALAAVRAELAELKGGKKDKGGVLGAIKEAREIMGLLGGKTDALDAAAKAAEVGDQNQTLEIIDTIGDKLEAPFKMLASEFMADREAKRKAAAARRGGYVQRGSGLLAAKRAKLADGTEIEVPDDMVLLNDGTMIPLASWGNYLAAMQTPQVPQFAPAPAFPQAPMFAFAPPPQVAAFAPQPQAPMFAPPQVAAFAPPADATQTAQEEAPPPQEALPPQEAPPQVEVIEEAQEPPAVSAHDGPALDEVPEFTG